MSLGFDPASLIPIGESMARAALPTLSTILGAAVPFPFSLFVGPAFAAIAAALGDDPATATPATVKARIDADPAAAATKLQPIEDHFAAAAEAAQQELDARLHDVQDARATELQYVGTGSALAWAEPALGVIVTVGFIATTLGVIFRAVDQGPVTIYLITTLGGGFLMLLNFYFGSSAGSKSKDDTLATLAKAPQVIQGPVPGSSPGTHVSGGIAPKPVGR
jgi:hypothetical protein